MGELVAGRCRATNLCPYCQRLYVVETVEMLTLDALEHAPSLWVVLTAREHLTRPDTYAHLSHLRRSLRRKWPAIEWFVQVEFQRRGALHLNLLVKGVPVEDRDELRQAVVELWCRRVDALPVGQWVEQMRDGYAVTRYCSKMLAHGLKGEQAPPIGWKGHRTSQTRGYLVRPASVMRAEAKASLRSKRELNRQLARGLSAQEAEAAVAWALAIAEQTTWELIHVLPETAGDGEPPHLRMRRHLTARAASASKPASATSSGRVRLASATTSPSPRAIHNVNHGSAGVGS
jgi:hypothetical protein